MSADLHFRQDLIEIRLPSSLKISLPPIPPPPLTDESTGGDVDECSTPTSSEHRIPVILSCPPAPRKQRLAAPSCKRKLCELDFVRGDEIESFFRSSSEFVKANTKRSRCRL